MSHDFSPLNKGPLFDFGIIICLIVNYYIDPTSSYTFRTMKFALSFLETGKVFKRAFTQRTSVHDLYSFDMSIDLVIVLLNLCLSNKNLHDMLFPSYLDFEHHHAEFKESEFVLCELILHGFIANFQIVLYLFSLLITWPPFLLPLASVV